VPESLDDALAALRPLLLDVESLVRAVAAGRRRTARPAHRRAELRPVELKSGRHLQVVTTDEIGPTTRNHASGEPAAAAVDAVLAEPFGSWFVETADRVVQLRVTKRGEAQVHSTRTSRRTVAPAAGHDRPKQHLLDPADPLFDVLGAQADKRRQVDAFLRQLAPLVATAAERARAEGRPLHVVDLGCGNAYLTFAAHRYLTGSLAVRTVGIDHRSDIVARTTALADRLGLDGLTFRAGEITETDPELEPVDLVLALHACDTATDDALARAVRWNAAVTLAAPCCHHDIQRQLDEQRRLGVAPPAPYQALVRHRILGQRFADVLTDALRASVLQALGFRVDVVEFVDSRHTPRNALLRIQQGGSGGRARQSRTELGELAEDWHVRPRLAELLADRLARGEGR
jgi:SAM-dependent methyltransferase